jgi:DNA-binding CsgD family transcriptional regulator
MSEIVGRDEELASLRAFVDEPRDGPSALVLEGEAGVGKSTLWLAGVEHAHARGFRVLSSRPVEAEGALAYVGLGDLLEDVLAETLPALPPPRRRALEAALLLEEADENVDPRALGIATRTALEVLAEGGTVVVAIDDLQWLDAPSERALAFALRRIAGHDVRLLLARRAGDGAQPSALEEALGADHVEPLPVGPLSVGALHRLLLDRLGRPFPRQTLLRIHERSGGNPFFALELARVLDADADPTLPLPVPQTLDELLRARISGLPEATREALTLVAALGTPSEALLERAGVAPETLEPALGAHVVERADGTIRFTHPLLASVSYGDLGDERPSVHRRIAGLADDPLVRARHLALACEGPDAAVAGLLDGAAASAAERGASAVAAELAEHALRLTDAEEEGRPRRALAAARAHQAAGEWTRARAIANDLLDEPGRGPWRAEALVLLAELESVDRAVSLLEDALSEADSRPALRSEIHCRLAWAIRFREGYGRALEHARAALALANDLDDDELRERARVVGAVLGWIAGDADAPRIPTEAHDFPTAFGGERLTQEATFAVVSTLATALQTDEARGVLEREYDEWCERDEPRAARALWGLAWVEFWAGRWALAAEHAARSHEISTQFGLEAPQDHLPIALVAVHRGELELARAHSVRALELADEQFGLQPPQHLAILGLVARGEGDAAAAADRLEAADRRAAELGWGEPSIRWWTADHVELLLQLGRPDDAVPALDAWEADAVRLDRPWVLAHVGRCRGLVAAAGGEVAEASALLERAAAEHEAAGDPFGRARAQLALGVVRRRERRKRPAREAVEAALHGFEAIGAAGWAAQARAELGRIGGRTRAEGLTDAERRVAELVAQGHTNREVAASLFLGERTVASHLTHIYAKLGVRSRTELARRLQANETAP